MLCISYILETTDNVQHNVDGTIQPLSLTLGTSYRSLYSSTEPDRDILSRRLPECDSESLICSSHSRLHLNVAARSEPCSHLLHCFCKSLLPLAMFEMQCRS